VTRRLALLATLLALGCGGRPSTAPAPQSIAAALDQFLSAVKANNLTRMGNLFGDERGPASSYQNADYLRRQLLTIQKYLDHTGYRIVEGPLPSDPLNPTFKNVPSHDRLRDFRVELQHEGCNHVVPITLVQTNSGTWLVYDVHLEAAANPALGCGNRP
jgi:hypothetical protein